MSAFVSIRPLSCLAGATESSLAVIARPSAVIAPPALDLCRPEPPALPIPTTESP